MTTNNQIIFYCIAIAFFGIDIVSGLAYGRPIVFALMSICAVAFVHKITVLRTILLLLLIGFESFFFYDQCGLQLVYFLPLILIANRIGKHFSHPSIAAISFLFTGIAGQLALDFIFGEMQTFIFICLKIIFSIFLTVGVSLVYI